MASLDVLEKKKEQQENRIMTKIDLLNSMMELGYFCENDELTQWYNDIKGFTYNVQPGKTFVEIYKEAKKLFKSKSLLTLSF